MKKEAFFSGLATEEVGKAYFKENPAYPYDSVIVCSNGLFFATDIKGKNALSNFLVSNQGEGVTFKEIAK